MSQKRYKAEEIIGKLREAEVLLGQGMFIDEVCRRIEVMRHTYYRWRKEYSGLRVNQTHRLKELERENVRPKRLVADLLLDNQILKEAASGTS